MPAFYFYGVLLILTLHCVAPIILLPSVGYPHTSKYFHYLYAHSQICKLFFVRFKKNYSRGCLYGIIK